MDSSSLDLWQFIKGNNTKKHYIRGNQIAKTVSMQRCILGEIHNKMQMDFD